MRFEGLTRPQGLLVSVDICSQCNLNCEYCCNAENNKLNKRMSRKELDKVLFALGFSKLPIGLSIVGGEPSLHPLFGYFIDKAATIKNIFSINVTTNGTVPLKITPNPKIDIELSYHNSVINERQKQVFKKNVLENKDKFAEFTVMDMRYKDFESDIHKLLPDIEVMPKPIFVNGKPTVDIVDDCDKALYKYNDEIMSLSDVFNRRLNNFKGWNCYICMYIVDVNGDIRLACTDQYVGNIFNEPLFFRKHGIVKVKCDKEICTYDCLLDCVKEI